MQFNLEEIRFDRLEVTGFDSTTNGAQEQKLSILFDVSFPKKPEEFGDQFDVYLKVRISRLEDDKEEDVLWAQTRGVYAFEEGVEPYVVEDHIERVFATGLLYAGIRSTLDAILSCSGFPGLTLPVSLPLSVMDDRTSSDGSEPQGDDDHRSKVDH